MLSKQHSVRSCLILISIAAVLALSGCTKVFDHAAYVKALLDASYKAEFEEYVVVTESTVEEAQEQYDDNMESIVDDICTALTVDVSAERREKLKGIMENVFKSASYEIIGAEKVSEEQYDVELKIYPITNFKGFEEPFTEFATEFIENLYLTDLGSLDPDEVYGRFVDELIVIIEDGTKTITYGEEQSFKTPVMYNAEKKRWYISDSEQEKIFGAIIELNS